MSTYQSDDDGRTWRPAEPIGWQEEHGIVGRCILAILGVSHCGKKGWRR
jgi:hypothetical protein